MSSMQTIDRARLSSDLAYRVRFSREFIEFTQDDIALLHAAAPLILPVVTEVVDGVYEHLFEFSHTKEVFLKRPNEMAGEQLVTDITRLTLDSPQMVLRRKMLTHWLAKLLMADFDDMAIWEFMDKVGVMHTGQPAFKHRLNAAPLHVDLHVLTLTLGWIQDVVISIVMHLPREVLSTNRKCGVLKAFNKLVWLQQDLFQRHYVRSDQEAAANLARINKESKGEEELVNALRATSVDVVEREEDEAREAVADLPPIKVQ